MSLNNTCFNVYEEPIECIPDDAIKAFIQSNLDILAIGKYIAKNPDNNYAN